MTDLVCCLSIGKGTWGEVKKLLNTHPWQNIFLISNTFGKEKFSIEKPVKFILLEPMKGTESMKQTIKEELHGKLSGDVAVNITSGSGIEHMAMIAALMELGVGIRFVIPTDSDVKEV